ncbi:Gfo/Idh/MocA family protein [Glaciecola siphonariae]|uniref:Gfo/Idh/MocA family protein n=1 Tax=Glaciecola siphonariae TaxID=521012 RepID=A0ABV9LYG0_9ALTE
MAEQTLIRWGLLGCGHIAKTFVRSFHASRGSELLACAASQQSRAEDFAAHFGIPKVHQNYLALVQDESLDVIYIATTHNFHFEHIMLCLKHNKHVLCEKPLTVNAEQARKVKAEASKRNLLVVEAVWTRFLPAINALKHMLDAKVIGQLKSLYANFSLNRVMKDEHRLLNPALAGGALLDLGIYPITFADIVFDQPVVSCKASAVMSHTGVDEVSNYLVAYEGGQTALLSAGFRQSAPIEAIIYGDAGHIKVPHFLGARSIEVYVDGQAPATHDFHFDDDEKFRFEIEHVNDCLKRGLRSSSILPLETSIHMLALMDELRAQFGLKYPDEPA